MKITKLKLEDLKVKSFTTTSNESVKGTIAGGVVLDSSDNTANDCSGLYCAPTRHHESKCASEPGQGCGQW